MRVCSFESRRRDEMATLIRKFGGDPTVVPSMREVPLEAHTDAFEFARRIEQGEIEIVVFMTGVGARTLFDAIRTTGYWDSFQSELDQRTIIVRGPKPVPVLKDAKVHIDFRAPEPNTWRELLELIDGTPVDVSGKTIGVQEYGKPNQEFYEQLKQRGAEVYPVTVYAWDFPEDVEPLYAAIQAACDQPFDVVMFTSAQQVDNVLEAADRLGKKDDWRASLKRSSVASIGPTCSDRLREHGISIAMEPSHPKMAHLVREAIAFAQQSSAS
ncbi:uroporphyrinogen-III synthase [Rubinisphaera margarita]|uniref:uroporphyrinogen-III synthase n=1 Tax=Rubinisphaera margarita TaxID=2909586 RepID=UPI001EE7F37F|nr:uroporphyrinogen-III synthase [Rubinisphaera margarita]MCG6156021.1 uroporphyrinogen-III synthase [Rubinisphaera margarita]